MMDENTREQAFRTFVSELPSQWQVDLMSSDVVPTAVIKALEAGWQMQHLVDDAQATYRRGQGIGMLVTRLRSLGQTKPVRQETRPTVGSAIRSHSRPDVSPVTTITSHPFRSDGTPEGYCGCGLPSANSVHVGVEVPAPPALPPAESRPHLVVPFQRV